MLLLETEKEPGVPGLLPVQSAWRVPQSALVEPENGVVEADIVIIGSGMGGGTLAYALRESGARVLVVERGEFLPREFENWSPDDVFMNKRYRNAEQWYGADGSAFSPGVYYYVGGNTKLYGASLPRFRETDFSAHSTPDGDSTGWPITYAELEPYYVQAERMYLVHGNAGEDPTDPWRSADYPWPALEHESPVRELAEQLADKGLRPFSMPTSIDRREGGRCVRCRTCDGFPCMVDAKADADVSAMRPALEAGVQLLTRTKVQRLESDGSGRIITSAQAERDGKQLTIRAGRFVVSCGAVNSAALLLASRSSAHPYGLANSSGQVGANYMVHNSTFLIAMDPRRRNRVVFQKTLGLNDWYLAGPDRPALGNLQMLGKLQGPHVKPARPRVPMAVLDEATSHSMDFYLTTEDVPSQNSRVVLGGSGHITVHWQPTNVAPHKQLVKRVSRLLRGAGYPAVMTQRMGIDTNSHQCGTAVMGDDSATSVLDRDCKAHDVDNLWVVDSSCFPSSAAVNPALTIAAVALRVADTGVLVA